MLKRLLVMSFCGWVAVCCGVLRRVAVRCSVLHTVLLIAIISQACARYEFVAVLQCVVVCCRQSHPQQHAGTVAGNYCFISVFVAV